MRRRLVTLATLAASLLPSGAVLAQTRAPMRVLRVVPRRAVPGAKIHIYGRGFDAGVVILVGRRRMQPLRITRRRITFVLKATAATTPQVRRIALRYGPQTIAAGVLTILPTRAPVAAPLRVLRVVPRRAVPGATVSLYGTGFRPGVRLQLGRMWINTTSLTPRRITFVVPRAPGGARVLRVAFGAQRVAAGTLLIVSPSGVPHPGRRQGHDRANRVPPAGTPPPGATPTPAAHRPTANLGGQIAQPTPEELARIRERRRERRRRWRDYRRRQPMVYDMRHVAGDRYVVRGRNFSAQAQIWVNKQRAPQARVTRRRIMFRMPVVSGRAVILLRQPNIRRPIFVGMHEAAAPQIDRAAEARRIAEQQRLAQEAWKRRQAELAAKSRAERLARYQREWKALQARREERRRARVAAMRRLWQRKFLAQEQVKAELALHARRVARLRQMKRIAEFENLGKLVVRVQLAIGREQRRHRSRMGALREAFKAGGLR